jgi:hypothetical protein
LEGVKFDCKCETLATNPYSVSNQTKNKTQGNDVLDVFDITREFERMRRGLRGLERMEMD